MSRDALECQLLTLEWADGLMKFLDDLQRVGDDRFFHPHEFRKDIIETLCNHDGRDLYYILSEGKVVLGYGLLRGWDDGFEIPSLGIAIHPSTRRSGLGRTLMAFLHAAASRQGAEKVRLRVSPENIRAIALYESLGYVFIGEEVGLKVGIIQLRTPDDE